MPSSNISGPYTTTQVLKLTGISKDMLNYLCKVGVVVPSVSRRAEGTGHHISRLYSFRDLMSFKLVERLAASGVQPMRVKKAIQELHAMGISLTKLPSSHVVIANKSVYRWDGKGNPFRVVDGQMAFGFILDVSTLHRELIRDLDKLAA